MRAHEFEGNSYIKEGQAKLRYIHYAEIANKAHDDAYGWGIQPQNDTSKFGVAATHGSVKFAEPLIKRGPLTGQSDEDYVEEVSSAIHKGWASVARNHPDQTPEQKARRKILADTPYDSLSDEEKEKDRVVAIALIKYIREN